MNFRLARIWRSLIRPTRFTGIAAGADRHMRRTVPILLLIGMVLSGNQPSIARPTQWASSGYASNSSSGQMNATSVMSTTLSAGQTQSLLPLFASGLRLGPALPTLLGLHAPQTYLILVQNNQELRATGGFISALGKVTIDKAKVVDLDFTDSYNLFHDGGQYPPAPVPMQRYMGIPLLLLRDANWSPDFPTTAKLIKALYAQETGMTVDGIITVDLHAVELIIDALGAIEIAGASEPLTGANLVEQVQQFWNQPLATGATITTTGLGEWWGQRKDFIPAVAQGVLGRLQSGDVDYFGLLRGAQAALNERAVQIWMADPMAAAQLGELGWDGSLQPEPDSDFLALVDTNMGYNKVNAVVKPVLDYTVTWPADTTQPGLATATITYTHPITQPDPVCQATPYYGETYADMIERCYFNYVRLYTPGGSKLIGVEGVDPDSVSSGRGEHNLRLFAGYFILHPGEQRVVTFRYALPAHLKPDGYTLVMQRQSGASPLPLTVRIQENEMVTRLVDGRLEWAR